ncbi:putative ABC transporter ATP-binding protein YadG [Rubritalea halochordaticola]|uniref:ABC transporter ATP-binding protein YadG n=1 Tax=Rubritalea halochordaticola TaxID=714537 RepID=A0ABP9UXA2_9BACT
MNDQPCAIDICDVRKRYKGKVEALRGINLKVPKGQIFGLLGPNGAGKSTLLKILLTIIKPTRCKGVLLGHPVGHKPTLRKVGYLPEHARFPEYLTGRQVIAYSAGLCDVPRKFAKKREGELLEFVGMCAWADRKMETYSKGMKQRIGLAQSLVNDPEIVFLDEPTDGVDPQGRREMRNVLKELKDQGRTVFINSHMLGELEMVCDSVAILSQGEVIKQGNLDALMNEDVKYSMRYHGQIPSDLLEDLEQEESLTIGEGLIEARVGDASDIQHVIDALRLRGIVIEELRLTRQSLEDLFMAAVEGIGPGGYVGANK